MRFILLFCLIAVNADAIMLARVTRTAPDHWLVCHGDSITMGVTTSDGGTQKSYPYLVAAAVALAQGYIFGDVNYGINGQGLNYVYTVFPSNSFGTLTADAVTRVDPILSKSGTKKLVVFAGTNDIFLNSASGTTAAALLQTYIDARITAGWTAGNICVCTMLPRQGTHESDRTTLNSDIRTKAGTKGYVVADLAANHTIGDAGDDADTTYFNADRIHLTDAGQVVAAGIIQAALYP